MRDLSKAMAHLQRHESSWQQRPLLSFGEFLQEVVQNPERVIRDVYQVYTDMVQAHICEGVDEYNGDPESINYLSYDCNRLFAEGSDRPFFADRLFANRFMRHVESLAVGAQQNKIYIFDGPHGSGKSTFLNNLLQKFEAYANTLEGARYEVIWRLPQPDIALGTLPLPTSFVEKVMQLLQDEERSVLKGGMNPGIVEPDQERWLNIPCPSHDNPILMIPKDVRPQFFDELFGNDAFKWRLHAEKQFEWLFRDEPCTICTSLYEALLRQYKDPEKVMECVFARPYIFNRRQGEGVSVFNPGDKPARDNVIRNDYIQPCLDALFTGSRPVHYVYSRYAKTNNGIHALMDIKSHNTGRLMELHNIISDGVHKVGDIEERVNSLLFALMNPEDKKVLTDLQALSDRIEYINIPYVLDLKTEVDIYRAVFGRHIEESFLPRVLHNFARVIIATRLTPHSEAMREWIKEPEHYQLYCDKDLLLLKMEIFTGYIPPWLDGKDVERFTAKRRRKIILDSEKDGWDGLSGRDSIKMFNEFYTLYGREDKLIDMTMLGVFFRKYCKEDPDFLPKGFLDSLLRMYNYTVLQEVKESLYYYNKEQITRDISNYIFAVNFEPGSSAVCTYTGDRLEVGEAFYQQVESRLLVSESEAADFRNSIQKSYTTVALPQEIIRDNRAIDETSLFQQLHDRYIHTLKTKVLEPFIDNENFRRAVKDFDLEDFKTYDRKIQNDVTFMIDNLQRKYGYSRQGAKGICSYVIDNNLTRVFNQD
ncbi:serine protein kinase PrkA [Desulfogranum mediterraneum]|uniref:serine protein kinase PrkA n=1 Tax=Desulfogranum mediterraneum TaxID=160661 RepID=UPI00048E6C49|nr:serine protein kinase PrkA [Desulfogranum mediterraneum]